MGGLYRLSSVDHWGRSLLGLLLLFGLLLLGLFSRLGSVCLSHLGHFLRSILNIVATGSLHSSEQFIGVDETSPRQIHRCSVHLPRDLGVCHF
ncbi:hypothetical protein PMAYCL1PPCAC_12947 [Pristionchus mayeri]|uniref:Uncharacterized protein n=1 Tax=Pristionchus mayeri TaxID=1317129 RepID=A0AAN5CG21_9BILA|nr:hypothetical protein PMAYCL1PPCAC_12947 [Pristionchus mayeri]